MNSSRVFGFMRHISISVASLKTTYAGTLCRMARLFRSSLRAASSFSSAGGIDALFADEAFFFCGISSIMRRVSLPVKTPRLFGVSLNMGYSSPSAVIYPFSQRCSMISRSRFSVQSAIMP